MKMVRATCLLLVCLYPCAASAVTPTRFFAVTPCRLLDTTQSFPITPISSGVPYGFQVIGKCGIPSAATAVYINLVSIAPSTGGFLTAYPNPGNVPGTSIVNVDAGERWLANGTIVALGSDPTFQLNLIYGTGIAGSTHVIVDVMGYYTP
jgi:hypothetical protein